MLEPHRQDAVGRLAYGIFNISKSRIKVFGFDGYEDTEIDSFMTRFELYFRRGGG